MSTIIDVLLRKFEVVLSPDSLKEFNDNLVRKEYQKDEIILNQGEICRDFYFVERGIIRQFYYKNGRDITEHFSSEAAVACCVESLFLNQPTTLLMEAIAPTVVYCLNYETFTRLCDRHNDINLFYRRIFEADLVITQQKADSWRFESSRERYERFCREYPEVNKRASIAHIATYLLMTPETLSRVRAGVL